MFTTAFPAVALAILALASPVRAQVTSTVLVDLGSSSFLSNPSTSETWNDVTNTSQGATVGLLDTSGVATGIQWSLPDPWFFGASAGGTTNPQSASSLDAFPASATRDSLWAADGFVIEIELAGVGPNTLVDLTFSASRLGVGGVRTTDYLVQGFNGGVVTLDATDNTSETVEVEDVLADASGKISIRARAATSNTSPDGRFYLGVVRIELETFASKPAHLGFDTPFADASRVVGGTPFSAPIRLSSSTGATPTFALTAVDALTGFAPTWLTLPGGGTAGTPFDVTFDPSGLPLGAREGTITASASGYDDRELALRLVIREDGLLHLLYYGNSYSQGNLGIAPLVADIAEEAGHPAPWSVSRLEAGQDLQYHLTNPNQVAAISNSLPLGESWDAVVIQAQSVEPTALLGDPAQFRAEAVALVAAVRAHSPDAVGVMFQTWARGPGHSAYPSFYANPLAMHAELRKSYRAAVVDIESTHGPGTGRLAAAGDVVALAAFDTSWYVPDLSHPSPKMTLGAAMTIYQAIYRERSCDVEPDFAGSSNLVTRLASLHLFEAEWEAQVGLAERCADAELRRYPGSSADLLLQTGVDGPALACPAKTASAGQVLSLSLTTPNGVFAAPVALIFVDAFPTGSPPTLPTPWPELHVSPLTSVAVAGQLALGGGLSVSPTLPILGLSPGTSLRVQGVVFAPPGGTRGTPPNTLPVPGGAATPGPTTPSPFFTTTDAHEIAIQ